METLNSLNKVTRKQARRVGRGFGSKAGGHTTGRGAKGDKVRGKTKLTFDGSKIKKSWIKRLPFLRGKHRLTSAGSFTIFSLGQIDKWFKDGETVDVATLTKKASLTRSDRVRSFKVLSQGGLTKILNFKGLILSETTRKTILKAGGKID